MKFALEPPSMECFNSPDARTQKAKSQTEWSACSFRTFAKASQECGPDSWKRSAFCNGNEDGPPAEGEMYRRKLFENYASHSHGAGCVNAPPHVTVSTFSSLIGCPPAITSILMRYVVLEVL
jgi:hypothetical protein